MVRLANLGEAGEGGAMARAALLPLHVRTRAHSPIPPGRRLAVPRPRRRRGGRRAAAVVADAGFGRAPRRSEGG